MRLENAALFAPLLDEQLDDETRLMAETPEFYLGRNLLTARPRILPRRWSRADWIRVCYEAGREA